MVVRHPIKPRECHYGPESGVGGIGENNEGGCVPVFTLRNTNFGRFVIQSEISEVL